MSSPISPISPNAPWCSIVAFALLSAACTATHRDPISTETGNPPVIDAARVSIVVSPDEVHVVGAPGAVEPGGIALEITVLATGEVKQATAAADGSFDVSVDASPDGAFLLRATDGDAESNSVYALRDGASVGEASDGGLSCDQRNDLAARLIRNAESAADRSCAADADCVNAGLAAVCVDACYDAVVSRAGKAEIEAVVDAVEQGVCASFESDGCQFIAQPCVALPPASPACVSGRCELAAAEPICPPNGGYVRDVCLECGPAGGCLRTEATCARVCSENEHCAGDPNGSFCTSRGICEAFCPF